jgi:uncharacterized NAD(P)/FAD-binding protein YdhS
MIYKNIKEHMLCVLKTWCSRTYQLFTTHPHDAGETYLQHFWFVFKMGLRFLKIFFAILIHGVFPFLCTRTASNEVKKIYAIMQKRAPDPVGEPSVNTRKRVAIIGGGFSGALTLVQMVKQAVDGEQGVVIDMIEPHDVLGQGVAYGTHDIAHLLNVRAGNMGAFADDVGHFYTWLRSDAGQQACQGVWSAVHKVSPQDFVPRSVYAIYVDALVQDALRIAKNNGIEVRHHRAHAVDAKEVSVHGASQLEITLADVNSQQEHLVSADMVVLATGNLPPRKHAFISDDVMQSASYIHDMWHAMQDDTWAARISALRAEDTVVIIGTGLTMVDSVLSLRSLGYRGNIVAISRSGWLPHAHDEAGVAPYPAWAWCLHPESAPNTALGLLVGLRQEIRTAAAQGYDWRRVIDSLRPVTQQLWAQLPVAQKKKFYARLFTLWNIHRHRMSPDIATKIHNLQRDGVLKVVAGRITQVDSTTEDGLLNVKYIYSHNKNVLANIDTKMLVNCTGPDYRIHASGHALLQRLLEKGFIQENPLGIGITMTTQHLAQGSASTALIPVGTLRIGEMLECTAVPELRQQVYDVACRITQHCA